MAKENQTQRDPLLYGIIGVLIGGVIVWFMATNAVNNNNTGMMQMMGMRMQNQEMMNQDRDNDNDHQMQGMGMSMQDMMGGLEGKTGDAFDKAFLSEMIVHHQGAINMAKEAKTNAKHDELKSMADDIISTQSKEIDQMKQWQQEWGY